MQNVQHALTLLRSVEGLHHLEINADGNAEIVIEGALSIYLQQIDEMQLEYSCVLDEVVPPFSQAQYEAMLTANMLGDGTGPARLAMEADTKRVVLCQRVDVSTLDATDVETGFTGFVQLCVYWLTDGTDALLDASANDGGSVSDFGTMIRV